MSSISYDSALQNSLSGKSKSFIKRYSIASILRKSGAFKLQGFSSILCFFVLFQSVFFQTSLFQQYKNHKRSFPCSVDTLYRFLNSTSVNWWRFTTLLSLSIIKKSILHLTEPDRRKVLIVDDSLFSRAHSSKVELLSSVYDHAAHGKASRYVRGFRMLTLGWSDGNTFLPISHCLLSGATKKTRIQGLLKPVDWRTNGARQRRLSMCKATDVMLKLLRDAKVSGIPATHVLFDTWFCFPSSLIQVKKLGYDVVAMVKKAKNFKYLYQGESRTAMQIFHLLKKRPGRSKYLLSVDTTIQKGEETLPVRLVFVRKKGSKKDYLVLISTDMNLTPEEIIQTYGKRWSIEVFFEVCKTYLRLSKEFRSLSYDAMTAHVSIVFARYMMLAIDQRERTDERSLGDLFYLTIEELSDITYAEALQLLLKHLEQLLIKEVGVSEEEIDRLMDLFMKTLPAIWREIRQNCA